MSILTCGCDSSASVHASRCEYAGRSRAKSAKVATENTMDDATLLRSYKSEADMYRKAVVALLGLTHGRKQLRADDVFTIANRAHEESNRFSRARRGVTS